MVIGQSLAKGPSAHLSWIELACKDGTPYPQKFITDGRVYILAQLFEDIRALAGDFPIRVLSAYRTPQWNKRIGGAVLSQHVEGRALDLSHTKLTNKKFFDLIRSNIDKLGIKGIGRYPTFVHVDIRPTVRLASWVSSAKKEASV